MRRFLEITIFLTVASGLALHAGLELPRVIDWIGTLPGDMVIRKGDFSVYAPVTSSVMISAVLTFFLYLLFKEKN